MNPKILHTPEQIAKQFGGTTDMVRAKLRIQADWCDSQADKAERICRKVRGATAAEWRAVAANARLNSVILNNPQNQYASN